jgi:hypothetical protein
MNIKEFTTVHGTKVQLRAYDGYDQAKRSPKIKYLGQADLHDQASIDSLMAKLDDKQKIEFTEYLAKRKQDMDAFRKVYALKEIATKCDQATAALLAGEVVTAEAAAAVYEAMHALARQLKRSGHPRYKVVAGAVQK